MWVFFEVLKEVPLVFCLDFLGVLDDFAPCFSWNSLGFLGLLLDFSEFYRGFL